MDKMILRNLFVLISAAIFLGTIILNLLAIVYISSKRDRTSIAILVVNLAIADIIHAMGIIFFSSNLFTPNWVFGEFGCKFSLTIDVLCTVVIVYTVAALSVERYIDARAKLTTKCRLYITLTSLILIWTVGLLLPYPFIFYTFLYDSTDPKFRAADNLGNKDNQSSMPRSLTCQSLLSERELVIYEILLYIIAFLIPYLIIVLFSLKLLNFLRQWLTRKEKLTRTRINKRRTRGVKLVLCIVLSFLLCYTPFWIFKFYTAFFVDETVREKPLLRRFLTYMHQLVVLLSHVEGILNPLFFIVLTEHFSLTFSKHRRKHLHFLKSRPIARTVSISLPPSSPRRALVTTATPTGTTVEKTDLNGFSSTNDHFIDDNDKHPVVVLRHSSSASSPQRV